jgi:hypothetical protein
MEKGQIYNIYFHETSQFLLADDLQALSGIIWISPRTTEHDSAASMTAQNRSWFQLSFTINFNYQKSSVADSDTPDPSVFAPP